MVDDGSGELELATRRYQDIDAELARERGERLALEFHHAQLNDKVQHLEDRLAQAAHAEVELQAVLNTKTFRATSGLRKVYGKLRGTTVTGEHGAALRWIDEDVLQVGDTTFALSVEPDVYLEHDVDDDRFMLVKRREMIDWLVDRLVPRDVGTLLEVGVFKGGSTAFLNELLRPEVQVAVELATEPLTALERFAKRASGRLEIFYGVDQADELKLVELLDATLGDRQLDVVVDDASHFYRETRATFEVAFPRLRPGGQYIIEDWNWAHMDEPLWQHAGGYWHDRPALTNLVVELVMLAGTDRSIIEEITIDRDMVEVVRGPRPLPTPFRLAHAYLNRGLRFRPIL